MNSQHALLIANNAHTVMLFDDVAAVADSIAPLLSQEGYDIVSCVHTSNNLYAQLRVSNPAIVIINTDTLTQPILEFLVTLEVNNPKPVLLFIASLTQQEITLLIELGVSSIVVGRYNKSRLKSIIDVALARFDYAQSHQ